MPTSPPITIEFENRAAEHVRAAQRYYRSTFFSIGDKIAAIILLLLGLGSTLTVGLHWWTVACMVLAPLEWFNFLSPFTLKAYLAFKQNPKYREPYHLTFDRQGIHFKTPTIDSHIDWPFYHSVLEDEHLFLLVAGKWMYTVIPKRAFADTADQSAFRELARQMITQREKGNATCS